MSEYTFTSIGTIHSCYKEKFGIPRQSGLVSSSAFIEIEQEFSKEEAFRELESFSHIWIVFVFNAIEKEKWKATVRPPRLGGNQRVGVFATRSMFRPNPIGMSAVELKSIERVNGKIIVNILGGDFLDGTPVIDIKPYVPYSDSIQTKSSGYADGKPQIKFDIVFADDVKAKIKKDNKKYPELEKVITEVLQLDPRPAYKDKKHSNKSYAIKLYDYDLKWHVDGQKIMVTSLTLLD